MIQIWPENQALAKFKKIFCTLWMSMVCKKSEFSPGGKTYEMGIGSPAFFIFDHKECP